MKQLHEYNTPETDALAEKIGDIPHGTQNPRYHKCRDLERRLAACRDALEEIANYNPGLTSGCALASIARKALTLTAPK
jgi:hypothetical protein